MVEVSTRRLVGVRDGVGGAADSPVHLAVVSDVGGPAVGVVGTVCGVFLAFDQVETVAPGAGESCSRCLLHQDATSHPPLPTAASYREWGWPVTIFGDQVLLAVGADAVALVLPAGLADAVTPILAARDRAAPVLARPGAPEHRILLAGEPFGAPLPWPAGVRPIAGAVPLPPSLTPLGPIRWYEPPQDAALRASREIDVFGAVNTTLRAAAHAQGEQS